ncbi:MAG: NUDIX domain-containing protein [Candidatus Dormibacteria bacterium]
MPALATPRPVGAQAIVVDDRGRVLIQLRLWPAGWEPPGGHVDQSEDPARTVVRETREETGLEIEVERLIGYYQFTGIRRDLDVVFRCRPVGGRPKTGREAWHLAWVAPARLPRSLFPWYRQRIADALLPESVLPVKRAQHVGLADVWLHGLRLVFDLGGSVISRRTGTRAS